MKIPKMPTSVIIGLVLILFVLAASGCTSSDSSSSGSDSSDSAVAVVISYPGSWSGAISDDSGTRSIEGSGDETIGLDVSSGAIAANAQKQDDGSDTLTISITKDGSTLEKQQTSAEYGVASVSTYL